MESYYSVFGGISPEFQKISNQASTNRRSEVDGPGSGLSLHTCGSKSAKEHARDLEKILGRKPNKFEVFNYIHTKRKDGGKYVDTRSEKVANKVKRSLEISPGPSVETDPDGANRHVSDKYTEAAGGVKKQRLYGTGNDHNSSKAAKKVTPPPNWERILEEALERGRAEGRAEVNDKMNAMGKKLSMVMEHLGGSRVFGRIDDDDDDHDDAHGSDDGADWDSD